MEYTFFAYLFHFYYTNSESEQNYTTVEALLSSHSGGRDHWLLVSGIKQNKITLGTARS